jgi:predicted short-subunit dehydrogenase-like oxidoreductase (DUF2520 family)
MKAPEARYATTAMNRSLSIIGAGRVGRELGRRLADQGWRVETIVTRSAQTARATARAIGAGRPLARLGPEALASQLILITTPDDAIESVARRLARLAPGSLAGRVVLHTSGALGSEALAALARLGAATGSMHPLQSFARGRRPRLEGVAVAVEGHPAARRLAARLARQMGGVPVDISGKAKAAYHAAGAFASPQLLAVVEAAVRLLEGSGFRRKQAVAALMPLARQTLENFERLGPQAAWTGPVSRGDEATIRRHEKELKKWPKEYREAYRALTNLQRRLLSR